MIYDHQPESGCPHEKDDGKYACQYVMLICVITLYKNQVYNYEEADQENYYDFQ